MSFMQQAVNAEPKMLTLTSQGTNKNLNLFNFIRLLAIPRIACHLTAMRLPPLQIAAARGHPLAKTANSRDAVTETECRILQAHTDLKPITESLNKKTGRNRRILETPPSC